MPQIVIDPEACKGCGLCVQACPQGVLAQGQDLNSQGYFYAQVTAQMRCIGCRLCCITCPDVAIRMRIHGTFYRYFQY